MSAEERTPKERTPEDRTREERTPPILRVDGAEKRYGDVVALAGVSFTVASGINGLLGANGAGKSTLFKAAVDLQRLDRGTIEIDGHDIRRDSLAARRQIGYLPEELNLYDRLSGAELLRLTAALKGLDNAEERRALITEFDLEGREDILIGGYSLGMRKKIGLAAALMGKPRLVLLDEPLNGLDTESMRRLRLRIEAMAAAGTTFLISSHVMSFIERVCARVLILRRGELAADASPDELRQQLGMTGDPFEDVFLRVALFPHRSPSRAPERL